VGKAFVLAILILVLSLGATILVPGPSVAGMQESSNGDEPASGTPIASANKPHDPLDSSPSEEELDGGDPLDGDPLDGRPAGDPGAPANQSQLEVERSARPYDEPATVAVYDDDPKTVWTPGAGTGETWFWLDLGLERPLREVRWLAEGSGVVEIAVSSDRRRWRDVDRIEVGHGWQGVELREDARYVRLTLLAIDDGGDLPAIAEAAVYGRPSVSSEQQAGDRRANNRIRQSRGGGKSAAEQEAGNNDSSPDNEPRTESRSNGRARIAAEAGETRCEGDRQRCRAQQGEVSVEEDCEREGTCTIEVRADGGTAVCDAAGGDETKAGRGEGKRGSRAGRCEAVANGGAVAIGDVNP
jgi:hypothetical protein